MSRTEIIVRKEESECKIPIKVAAKMYTQPEINNMVIKLSKVHGII